MYKPPPPSDAPSLDPFGRGKGQDVMVPREEDLLYDIIMRPGDVLFIPAAVRY